MSGQMVRGAVALLSIPVLVHFLGIREYGVWSLAYAVLGLMLIGETGISVAANVFLSADLAKNISDEGSWTLTFLLLSGLLVSTALGLLLWLFGPRLVGSLVAFSATDRTEAGAALKIAGLAVGAFIIQRVLIGVEQAFDRYAIANVLDSVQSVLANLGLIAIAWEGRKSIAMMKWQAFAWLLFLIAHCFLVTRLVRSRGLSFKWNGSKAKRMLRFTIATWTSTLGSTAFNACDRLIVGGVLGAPALGIYSAITNITSRINSFSGMAVQPLMPSLSRDSRKSSIVEKQIREAAHLNVLIAVEAGIFVCVLADWVTSLMIPGASSPQDILGLQIATVVYSLYSMNAPGYYILFSIGQEWKNAMVTLSCAGLSLGLILIGAHYFGLVGALAGNAGYLGTLVMIGIGIRTMGIAIRRYAKWIALPVLVLIVALAVAVSVQGYFWWRVAFVTVQAGLLMTWFSREQNGLTRLRLACGRVTQS